MKVSYGQLADFIYRPSYELQLDNDLINFSMALDDDIDTVLDIIAGHQYTPAIFYLVDLGIKIKNSEQDNALYRIYDHCSDQLIHVCIFTLNDLKQCIEAIPLRKDDILKQVVENDEIVERLFTSYSNADPQQILDCLEEQYPEYADRFMDYYQENFTGFSPSN